MKKLAIIAVLWLPFSLGCAAVCGFSGFFTLSAECGASSEKPWTLLRWVLDKIQPSHCEGAAKNEGLIHG